MSKPINPMMLGGFTVGAVFLLIAGIFLFGGNQLLKKDTTQFVIFFDSSLNGLEKGAPLKMQGVKIGEVTDIALQLDPKNHKIYKPVVVEIDRNTFTAPSGTTLPKGQTYRERLANRNRLIQEGIRARLETQSLLTGLLYIDLDLHPSEPPQLTGVDYKGLLELPSIPTTTEEIRNVLVDVTRKIQMMPIDEIVQNLAENLQQIKLLLESDDTKKTREALARMLVEMEKMVISINKNIGPLMNNANQTIVTTNKFLTKASSALDKTQDSMVMVGDAVGPESALNETLQSLNEAARSIMELTDYLERHPESLLSGKDQ